MHLSVISFKPCWQNEEGRWVSSGGFPYQMTAICSLFDSAELLVTSCVPQAGGIPLPENAKVVAMRQPLAQDSRRKLDVAVHFPYYWKIIRRSVKKADVVHAPLPGDLALLGMLAALLNRKRFIGRYGGSWENNSQNTAANNFTRRIMRTYAGGRNVMLATGIGETPPAERMHWIFSTALSRAELEAIQTDLSRHWTDTPELIYAGRFSAEKGLPVLLRALARLKAQGFTPLPRLTLAGEGPQRRELEELTHDLDVSDLVSMPGQLNRQALSARMAVADLCVQPSLTEGFSKAWLDALAHGLPVIASRVGAAAAVIGENGERGWLVKAGDEAELASRLAFILSTDIDWPELRQRCREFVAGLTLEAWVDAIAAICAKQWGWSYCEGKLRP